VCGIKTERIQTQQLTSRPRTASSVKQLYVPTIKLVLQTAIMQRH